MSNTTLPSLNIYLRSFLMYFSYFFFLKESHSIIKIHCNPLFLPLKKYSQKIFIFILQVHFIYES